MEPARKHRPEIEAETRPKLGVVNGGGESTSERGDLAEATQNSAQVSRDENRFGVIQGGGESTSDRADLRSLSDKEDDAGLVDNGLYKPTPGGPKNRAENKTLLAKVKSGAKKYGGPAGFFASFGIIGVILSGIFGTGSMIINLIENFTSTNDSSTTVMERRFFKTLNNMMEPTDPACANSKKLKCKMGRISNNALNKLDKKGIVAVFGPDTKNTGKRTGYPSKNPTHYKVTMNDGSTKTIKAKDFTGFLIANPGVASKVLGRAGAFNMRYKAWSGKYMAKKFYKTFDLKRDGGIADGDNDAKSSAERLRAAQEKLRSSTPGLESLASSKDGLKTQLDTKVKGQLGKAKKGGAAYTASVAGCISLKAPGYIAAGVAGAQLAQVLNIYMNVVASPGSKAKAAGVGSGFTGDDMDAVGSLLTNKTERESDGKMTSALDSQYLLAAMGANKGRPPVPKDFSPGYSVLTSSLVQKSVAADKKTESSCNKIMSPAAMYSAMAIDSAATVALSATVVGGLIKIAASYAVVKLAEKAVERLIDKYADDAIKKIAENDKIVAAEGEELGDVLGVSAMAFGASGGMTHHLPVLKQSQLTAYENVRQENMAFNQAMDVATLSPLDVSSQYTFLGSLTRKLQTAMITSSSPSTFGSIFSGMSYASSLALNPSVSASNGLTSPYCSYADEFGLDTGDEHTPAITSSGLPCTGITDDQAAMSTTTAINHMTDGGEGWIDGTADISDEADLEDLVSSGVIKSDTPLTDFIESCSNPASGDYIFNAAGCTANTATKNSSSVDLKGSSCTGEGEERVCANESPDYAEVKGVKDGEALAAISPFLIDYQILQTVNGEDEEPETAATVAATGAETFTVGTYNMCQELNHSSCPVDRKIEKIVSVIEGTSDLSAAQMDIIGAQELSQPTQKQLLSTLSGYDTYPKQVPANNGKAIIWNTGKFTKAGGESEAGLLTGVNGNGSSDSVDNNSFPWVHLTSTNGQSVYVMSVHSPNDGYGNPADRYENVVKIREWVQKKSADGSLVVLTGDFNNGAKQDGGNPGAYCYLTSESIMQHAADTTQSKPAGTACPGERVPIDQIYASMNVAGLTAKGWRHTSGEDSRAIASTDHSPAYVTYSTTTVGDSYGSGEVRFPFAAKIWNQYSHDFLDPHSADSGTWTSGVRSLAVDIGSPPDGTPVYAMVGGTVSQSDLGGHGLAIKSEIQGGTLEIAYAHGPRTNSNTAYAAGDEIMKVGALGNVSGGHLHLDMAFNGKGVCPQLVFKALGANQTVNFADLARISRAPC